ncbi:Dabb family protein [Nocardia tengchongensis]|uniref:Dabb family protein n=1 Tax=Nocardia tengchongensis TaxID=2055889 RepID=A0ABX8CJA9_9NOCA|nr:Dabb family protein [Nocardia tengchongensis]QVI19482.1 Dabb family protein [Nocardia tengchongensis]
MNLAHVVAFGFRDDLPEELMAALEEGLDALSLSLLGVVSYRHGRDIGLRPGNASYAVTAVFDSEDSLAAYLEHPDHLSLVERLRPFVETRSAVQFRSPGAA